ncbi:hypothetical protein ABMA28_011117 [Loxostege sticticalis]|uniref:Uncharacterized protein n=1 Tax=Loxostege sticticalis TaxID=481309 RepID=A0ABD0S689_LOXSC
MSPFKFLCLCIQACLLQVAYSQVITTGYNSGLSGISGLNFNNGISSFGVPDVSAVAQLPVTGAYGGSGIGEMTVAGEMTATGQTIVTGQVPVIGTVTFSGYIPASGVVSVAGNCGCGNGI